MRESRYWDEAQLATELRAAARAVGVPAASHDGLVRMIRLWEAGDHKPSRRYRQLYRRIFPALQAGNGPAPDVTPAVIGDLLARADRSGSDDIRILAAAVRDLQRQVADLAAYQKQLSEEGGGAIDEEAR